MLHAAPHAVRWLYEQRLTHKEYSMPIEDYKNDNEYIASPEYLMESYINGQLSQCRRLISEYNHTIKSFMAWAMNAEQDSGLILEVVNRVFPVD